MTEQRIILASASPRRRELLTRAGIDFDVRESPLPEPDRPPRTVSPRAWAESVAYFKARAVAEGHRGRTILAADTIVECGGDVLGKPLDAADAERMLRLQAGRVSEVITGVAVLCLPRAAAHKPFEATRIIRHEVTYVRMGDDDALIREYVASGDWAGKAGAYGIQNIGDRLIERIDGDFDNVVGLPVALVMRLLRNFSAGCSGDC
ncbi:MAG: septum formation protein Maf [Phycisphaerales bacterium]|nr:septum formation protein Maf [Phycisphaerales bacterium]